MKFEAMYHTKYLFSDCQTPTELATAMRKWADEIEEVSKQAVECDMSNISGGVCLFYTDDAEVAKKYGFNENEFDEDEEEWDDLDEDDELDLDDDEEDV